METCQQPPALGCSTPVGCTNCTGRAAVGKAYTDPHLASKLLPDSSLSLPNSTIYSFQMPPLRNHTSYYSENYFLGTLNIFVGSLAPSTLTAHSITFTRNWKRLVIFLLSGTLLLAYYCFLLQYRSKLDVRHRKMPSKALVHSQEQVTTHSPKPDTHWHITINTRFAMSPLPFIFLSMRMGKNRVIAIFFNICKVLISYSNSQKLRQTLGQTDSSASVSQVSSGANPHRHMQPIV